MYFIFYADLIFYKFFIFKHSNGEFLHEFTSRSRALQLISNCFCTEVFAMKPLVDFLARVSAPLLNSFMMKICQSKTTDIVLLRPVSSDIYNRAGYGFLETSALTIPCSCFTIFACTSQLLLFHSQRVLSTSDGTSSCHGTG